MNITQHAKERYAQRIMGYDNKTDMAVFISKHEKKIAEDLEKMIVYGELIYSGRSLKQPNSTVDVYVKDLWVIIYDPNKDNIVTVYNIDFGIGEEFDELFMKTAIENINAAKQEYEKTEAVIKRDFDEYEEKIKENAYIIDDFKAQIKNLESLNQSFKDTQMYLRANLNAADRVVREKVEVLTGRKIF